MLLLWHVLVSLVSVSMFDNTTRTLGALLERLQARSSRRPSLITKALGLQVCSLAYSSELLQVTEHMDRAWEKKYIMFSQVFALISLVHRQDYIMIIRRHKEAAWLPTWQVYATSTASTTNLYPRCKETSNTNAKKYVYESIYQHTFFLAINILCVITMTIMFQSQVIIFTILFSL